MAVFVDNGLFRILISYRSIGWSLLREDLYSLLLIFSYGLTFFLVVLMEIGPKSKVLFLMEENSCHFPSGKCSGVDT